VGSDSGRLFALDLATGKKKWVFEAGARVHCSPAVGKGLVVFGADNGKLYAIDASTGKEAWSFQTGDWVRAAPAIVGDKVIFGSWDYCVYALSLAEGKQLWRFATNHKIHVAPVVYKDRVFTSSADWITYALNLETGKLDWYQVMGLSWGAAIYRDVLAMVRMGRSSSTRYIRPETGAPAMKARRAGYAWGATIGTPAFSGDWMFASGARGTCSVNLRKEKGYKGRQARGASCLETPLVGGDVMIVATLKGAVEAHTLYDGTTASKKLWEWKAPSGKMFRTAPVAAAGRIVVGNEDGFVYGFTYGGK
jgi:outer membrane protein assembly factor BamB